MVRITHENRTHVILETSRDIDQSVFDEMIDKKKDRKQPDCSQEGDPEPKLSGPEFGPCPTGPLIPD